MTTIPATLAQLKVDVSASRAAPDQRGLLGLFPRTGGTDGDLN